MNKSVNDGTQKTERVAAVGQPALPAKEPSRACACYALAKNRCGGVGLGAVLLCPFTVSRRSRRQGRRVPARLRPVAVLDP